MWWMAISVILLFVAIAVLPVAAETTFPSYQDINITTENGIRFNNYNDGTYFFKLEGGGLNALHITNDPINATRGQVTKTTSINSHFWLSDTGGRGFDDDGILFICVNGTPPENFNVRITSSGYNWTPTGALNQLPAIGAIAYNASAVNNVTFTAANFTKLGSNTVVQKWKPATLENYPILSGQYMGDSVNNNFKFIPVDLKVGIIGTNANSTYNGTLIDHGALRVDYTIENLGSSFVAFNAYAYTNQSNQGQGVSWLNAVNTSTDGPGTDTYSGWLVTPL
jgi:hypothetical protein